jgi:hypothetical protein
MRYLHEQRAGGRDSISRKGKTFSPIHCVQITSGAHSAFLVMYTGGLSPRVKRLEHEADRSPPPDAKVNIG